MTPPGRGVFLTSVPRLGFRLASVTRHAQALPTCQVVAASPVLAVVSAHDDRADMVCVCLTLAATDSPARSALPRIALQHRDSPRLVLCIAVASLRCGRAAVDTLCSRTTLHREHRHFAGHQFCDPDCGMRDTACCKSRCPFANSCNVSACLSCVLPISLSVSCVASRNFVCD